MQGYFLNYVDKKFSLTKNRDVPKCQNYFPCLYTVVAVILDLQIYLIYRMLESSKGRVGPANSILNEPATRLEPQKINFLDSQPDSNPQYFNP